MAIDTLQKRFSIQTIGTVPIPPVSWPDGSVSRRTLSWMYAGIDLASPVTRIYVPFELIFSAYSTKELVFSAYSTAELTFDGYSTNELTFEG